MNHPRRDRGARRRSRNRRSRSSTTRSASTRNSCAASPTSRPSTRRSIRALPPGGIAVSTPTTLMSTSGAMRRASEPGVRVDRVRARSPGGGPAARRAARRRRRARARRRRPATRRVRARRAGRHNAANALAAATAALAIGVPLAAVVRGPRSVSPGRRTARRAARRRAAPRSSTTRTTRIPIRCARRSTCSPRRRRRDGWCWATWAKSARRVRRSTAKSATYAREAGIDRLLHRRHARGRERGAAFGAGAQHFASVDALAAHRRRRRRAPATTVLVKGSRFMRMERVVAALDRRRARQGAH